MRAEEQSKIREAAAGTIFLLIGTVCFASKSIWIKWAYQMGAEPDAVSLYRHAGCSAVLADFFNIPSSNARR